MNGMILAKRGGDIARTSGDRKPAIDSGRATLPVFRRLGDETINTCPRGAMP
jgi:hypothetical protein